MRGWPFLGIAACCAALSLIPIMQCNSGRRMNKIIDDGYRPTPVPAATEVPAVEPSPEPTAAPAMMKVSLLSQNNSNLGRWTVSCPNGCPSVGEVIHDDQNGVWFNDVNNKFVWIKQGSGTILIEGE